MMAVVGAPTGQRAYQRDGGEGVRYRGERVRAGVVPASEVRCGGGEWRKGLADETRGQLEYPDSRERKTWE
jgi:hypothetical protein